LTGGFCTGTGAGSLNAKGSDWTGVARFTDWGGWAGPPRILKGSSLWAGGLDWVGWDFLSENYFKIVESLHFLVRVSLAK
jgi:hypothetical protein